MPHITASVHEPLSSELRPSCITGRDSKVYDKPKDHIITRVQKYITNKRSTTRFPKPTKTLLSDFWFFLGFVFL